jgi:DNA gyrase subunit A
VAKKKVKKQVAERKQSTKTRGQGSNGTGNGTMDLFAEHGDDPDHVHFVSISEETRRRYLNYALSVITSRALPDVRDGLKPVQRRIMYVMYHGLRLTQDSQARKCAKIAGDTSGNFHPHGPSAIYDALVRMAQDFSLRYPLVDGQGNFGSVMGLKAAADRYTEARLTRIAEALMSELRYETVDMRPNYDATREEPVVLPAQYPNLLVNGTQGIAVGMATNIPPHNLTEVIKACVHLIKSPQATTAQLMKYVKGPDFPLGGRIVTDRREIRKAYETGRGTIKVRGEWKEEKKGRQIRANHIVIRSVPYGVATGPLLQDIGDLIANRKLPQLENVLDETNEENGLRIVLEMKPGSNAEEVMAYLFRHTNLESGFSFNMTALTPDEKGTLVPKVLALPEMLRYFLDFRFETVKRRFEYQLRQLEKRIHILKGFVIVFDGLDKALRIIRKSSGKQDAATKLMKAFPLDEIQTDAVLEIALYKISMLEIGRIKEELKEKEAEAARIRRILGSTKRMWGVIEKELNDLAAQFGDKRRTSVGSADEVVEFDPTAYIIKENTNVVVTRDGWVKRVGRIKSVESTRTREGDTVLEVVPTSTLDHVVFFSSCGAAFTLAADQIPVSSGYGDPLGKYVRMGDGASIVAAIGTDDRFTREDKNKRGQPTPAPYLLIVTAKGQVMRLSFSSFRQQSTKAGRKYARLRKGDRVAYADLHADDAETMFIATKGARIVHFEVDEVPILTNAGKGVRGIKLEGEDEVLGAMQLVRPSDCLRVKNTNDKVLSFGQMKYGVTSRGGKGVRTSQRNGFDSIIHPEIELVDWSEYEEE